MKIVFYIVLKLAITTLGALGLVFTEFIGRSSSVSVQPPAHPHALSPSVAVDCKLTLSVAVGRRMTQAWNSVISGC